ncbi:ABC-2 type transporter [compost metagenome]
MIGSLIQRNIRIFFRDKMNVFFALLASLIMFVLYVFFLGQLQVDGMKETFPNASEETIHYFVNSWVFAGILTITSVTTGLAALQVFVSDRASGRFKDFAVSPVAKWKLVVAYLTSTVIIALGLTTVMLLLSEIYIVINGGEWLNWEELVVVYGYLILSTVTFAAISSFIAAFIKTESAFSSLSVIIGTSIGFLAGIYVPVGTLPTSVANAINVLPYSQAASMIREPFTQSSLADITSGNDQAIADMKDAYGMNVLIGDTTLTTTTIVITLASLTVVFGVLAVVRISKKLQ